MIKKQWPALIGFILAVEAVGFCSSLLSGDIGRKYNELILPPFSPPGMLFGIVWVILYAMMGIAAYLIYQSNESTKQTAMTIFLSQLALNFLWPILFFRFELLWISDIIIIILDILVACMIYYFSTSRKAAAYLIIPYFIWLLFATYLNIGVALLN